MPKVNKEKASDATVNPPHPGDPTSDVTRDGGEPLHKPPQEGAWMDADGQWHAREEHEDYVTDSGDDSPKVKSAAVPSSTGRDHRADGMGGTAQSPYLTDGVGGDGDAQAWRDDPMPEDARGRLEWATRGTDTEARLDAAIRAEQARGQGQRRTVLDGLEKLRKEHKRNESEGSAQ